MVGFSWVKKLQLDLAAIVAQKIFFFLKNNERKLLLRKNQFAHRINSQLTLIITKTYNDKP
jgi:hypothetical protein